MSLLGTLPPTFVCVGRRTNRIQLPPIFGLRTQKRGVIVATNELIDLRPFVLRIRKAVEILGDGLKTGRLYRGGGWVGEKEKCQ